jgi:hypothetical protein
VVVSVDGELHAFVLLTEERAMAELGLESSVLRAEYGPDLLVPVLTVQRDDSEVGADADGSEANTNDQPSQVPYVRELQQKRLRVAERELNLLGRVNPLALEEFDACRAELPRIGGSHAQRGIVEETWGALRVPVPG